MMLAYRRFGDTMRTDMITVGHLTQQGSGMILVIDDHPLFCEALQMTLSESLGLPRVATASTLEAGWPPCAPGRWQMP